MNKENINKFKDFLCKNFILIHIAICFIGFVFILTTQLFLNVSGSTLNCYPGQLNHFFPDKRTEIISYLSAVFFMFLLFFIYSILTANKDKIYKYFHTDLFTHQIMLSVLSVDLIANIVLSFKMGKFLTYSIVIMSIWVIIFVAPFVYFFLNRKQVVNFFKSGFINKLKKIFFVLLFIFPLFNLLYIFKPHVIDQLYIYHELYNIPRITKLGTKQVDNLNYIEQNQVFGYRKFYDIRNPQRSLDGINCIRVSDIRIKDQLNSIIEKEHINKKFNPKETKLITFFYSDGNKVCSISKMNSYEIQYLKNNLSPVFYNDYTKIVKNNFNLPEVNTRKNDKFYDLNSSSFGTQMMGFWAHHHNHITSSISKLNLGLQPSQVFTQYGLGTTLFLKSALNHLNGFNLGDYFRLFNSFYSFYYIAFFIILFVLFDNPIIILSIWTLVIIVLDKFASIHYYLAPGINPIRHLMDIFVICFFYLYLKNKKKINLFFADLFCLFGIFMYPVYGLFLSLSLIATFLFRALTEKSKFEISNAVAMLFVTLLTYKLFTVGPDLCSGNYMNGLDGFLATKYLLLLIYIIIMTAYVLIIKNFNEKNPNKDLLLFLVLYTQGLLLYFITISEITHFLVLAPIYILTFYVFLQLLKDTLKIQDKNYKMFNIILCSIFYAILIFKAFPAHVQGITGWEKNIKYHPTYNWQIRNSNFYSDMDPIYFTDSIKLLQKYSTNNKIYMISGYDNFLPVLADSYNAFPYIDLEWYMSSPKIYNQVKKQLINDKPKYILVDKFLLSGKLDTIVTAIPTSNNQGYFEDSLTKYYRYKNLQNLFNEVKDNYKEIDSSYLLEVYERKDDK